MHIFMVEGIANVNGEEVPVLSGWWAQARRKHRSALLLCVSERWYTVTSTLLDQKNQTYMRKGKRLQKKKKTEEDTELARASDNITYWTI